MPWAKEPVTSHSVPDKKQRYCRSLSSSNALQEVSQPGHIQATAGLDSSSLPIRHPGHFYTLSSTSTLFHTLLLIIISTPGHCSLGGTGKFHRANQCQPLKFWHILENPTDSGIPALCWELALIPVIYQLLIRVLPSELFTKTVPGFGQEFVRSKSYHLHSMYLL